MEVRQEEPEAANEPRPYCNFWKRRWSKLLLSSVNRGWRGLSAELRSHGQSVFPVWHPALFDFALYVCIVTSLVFASKEFLS
jgi:AraC family transcriptional regulator